MKIHEDRFPTSEQKLNLPIQFVHSSSFTERGISLLYRSVTSNGFERIIDRSYQLRRRGERDENGESRVLPRLFFTPASVEFSRERTLLTENKYLRTVYKARGGEKKFGSLGKVTVVVESCTTEKEEEKASLSFHALPSNPRVGKKSFVSPPRFLINAFSMPFSSLQPRSSDPCSPFLLRVSIDRTTWKGFLLRFFQQILEAERIFQGPFLPLELSFGSRVKLSGSSPNFFLKLLSFVNREFGIIWSCSLGSPPPVFSASFVDRYGNNLWIILCFFLNKKNPDLSFVNLGLKQKDPSNLSSPATFC